ncbi:zinc ribbon domain-containing protein [Jeotgalibaca ciconiae]|uniref:zinc ribbon domain-containing protein n=1 Tax=Jeotgalibaca ciconiae TaxID=2496265 RepID=UPI0013E08A90|nr:hypothetical protein [Jeotgalibaca ciconiae]
MKENKIKKITRNQKITVNAIAVIAFICTIVFNIGKTIYSKEGQIAHLLEILEKGDSVQAAKILTTDDPNFEITADSIQPYIRFVEGNSTYLFDLERYLSGDEEQDNLTMVQNGKTMFFFDNYDFVLEPVYMELHTNYKGTAFLIDGEEVQVSDSEDYSTTVGPYAPGEFDITAMATLNGFEFVNSDSVNLVWDYEDAPVYIDLPLEGERFKVGGDLSGWTVFVNGNPAGTLNEDGDGEFGPILLEKRVEIHAEKEYPSGTIATEPQILREIDEVFIAKYAEPLNLPMTSRLLFDLYFNIINHFHNSEEIEDRAYTELSELLVGGTENPIYDQIANLVSQNKADTEAYDIRFDHSTSEMLRTDMDTYEISMNIVERRQYPRRSSKESIRTVHPCVATIKVIETDEEGIPTKLQLAAIEAVD